eukprot:785432-Karenia_brevis.AAC.1
MRVRTGGNVSSRQRVPGSSDPTTNIPPAAPAENAPEAEPSTPGEASSAEVASRKRLPEGGASSSSSSSTPRPKAAPVPGARET